MGWPGQILKLLIMKTINTLLLLCTILFFGCEKTSIKDDENIVWETQFTGESDAIIRTDPLIYEDKLILFRDVLDFSIDETALMAFDKNTGEELWTWREIKLEGENGLYYPFEFREMLIKDGVLVGKDKYDLIGVDLETGKTIWRKIIDVYCSIKNGLFEDELYFLTESQRSDSKVVINKLDVTSGNLDPIHEIYPSLPGDVVNFNDYVFYKNENQETCIVLFLWQRDYPMSISPEYSYNLYHYNVDKDEVIFNIAQDDSLSLARLNVTGKIIFGAGSHLINYDLDSGDILFLKELPSYLGPRDIHFEYPYLYGMFNNHINLMTKLNMHTGKEYWATNLAGHQCHSIKKYGDLIYLVPVDGLLYIVDETNGQIREQIIPPYLDGSANLGRFFDDKYKIEESTGYFYMTDFKHLFCLNFNQ
jgi:outer membrane protein assembly factor BamB